MPDYPNSPTANMRAADMAVQNAANPGIDVGTSEGLQQLGQGGR